MPNPSHIIEGYWNLLFKKEDLEPLAQRRIGICLLNECGYFTAFSGGWCKDCKCFIEAKARCTECKCPRAKW